jgi:molecular chaperone DnaK (HSP70)
VASGTVTLAAFEEACGALFDRAMAPVVDALQGAGLKISEVDEVVLVGGSTRLPAVRSRLRELCGGKELRTSVDPDLAVAIGAAASGD